MKLNLKRLNNQFAFQVSNEDGQIANFDANPAIGGEGLGLRPMEMLAASLASCTSIDVFMILKKKRIELKKFEVEIISKRKDSIPSTFESIHLNFSIGKNDPIDQVEKAIGLSIEKYCSVAASLSNEIKISYGVNIYKE